MSNEILFLAERVKNSILLGESEFREFKSALEGKPGEKKPRKEATITKDIAEAMVAFANTDGGELIIGVEDNGEITGIPHSEKEINNMLNFQKTHLMAGTNFMLVHAKLLEIEFQKVLFFQVRKTTSEFIEPHQLSDGRVLVRKGTSSQAGDINKIRIDRQELTSREYDQKIEDGAKIQDLNVSLIKKLIQNSNLPKDISVEKYLQQIGVAEYSVEGFKLRRAALLLFAENISQWHPRSQIRILKIQGTILLSGKDYNVISDELIQGNIFELLDKSWEQLQPYLAHKTKFGANAQFQQSYLYPIDACRELILNALAHRDYSNTNGIEIHIFDDRMEIKSPGKLLSTLTVEDLEALDNRHESRNVKIAYALNVNGRMRELGEGIKRVFTLMKENELVKPRLYSNSTWFLVTLFKKSVFSAEEEMFLSCFSNFNLTSAQKRIILLGMYDAEITPQDVYKALNTTDTDVYQKEVTYLQKLGLLNSFRSADEAYKIAGKQGVEKRTIARYKVLKP